MRRDADRADAGAAAAVRDAKGFVQVEMANIGADIAGPAETDLCVHVRAVHVNLAAVLVHDVADLADGGFENAVGGGVRHHERRQIFAVRVRFRPEIGKVDIAVVETTHGDDAKPSHDRAGRVGAVGRGG